MTHKNIRNSRYSELSGIIQFLKFLVISIKKDPILIESVNQECSYINGFEYGGGGIRTHGALADTLVFKTRLF